MGGALFGDRYELGRELGIGGYARVFEATDLKIGRTVAVKLVATAFQRVVEANLRLEREGRIAASLIHPNICAVTDMGRLDNGAPFIVMEKLEGETLSRRLERPITIELALDIGAQLLAALSAAHARGIVHRDIKPANVFVLEQPLGRCIVKLLDFGIAQVPSMPAFDGAALTKTGFIVGTAEYMSPEQVRGERDFDVRSDVYSAGVVLYQLLSGARPFQGCPPNKLLDNVGYKKPPPLASVAPFIEPPIAQVIDRALVVDKAHRLPDAAAFLHALSVAARGDRVDPGIASQPTAPIAVDRATTAPLGKEQTKTDEWDLPTQQNRPPSDMEIDITVESSRGSRSGNS
jgi:eukaryotic-like serine/threonine-protein kinase